MQNTTKHAFPSIIIHMTQIIYLEIGNKKSININKKNSAMIIK